MNDRYRKKLFHYSNTEWTKLIYVIFTMIARCEIVGVSGIPITAKQLMFCHRSEEIKGRKIQTYVLCVTTLTLNEFNVWPKQRIVTVFDYSPGESNPFPKRMFQIQAMNQQIGAKKEKSVVFQTRFEITLALDHWAGWDTYLYVVHRPHFQNEHFLLYFSFSVHDSLQTCALKQKIQYNIMAKIKTSIIDEIRAGKEYLLN